MVDHVQHPETLAVRKLIVDEIQRPACIGPRLDQERCPCPDRLAPSLPFVHRQPFLAIQTVDPIDPGGLALAAQQEEESPIAEPTAFIGEFSQPPTQFRVGRAL